MNARSLEMMLCAIRHTMSVEYGPKHVIAKYREVLPWPALSRCGALLRFLETVATTTFGSSWDSARLGLCEPKQ